MPTFSRVIYSATLLEAVSTEKRLEVRKINGGQLRGRYENVLLWEPMAELPPPQGEMKVCVLSHGHFPDTLICCFYLFFMPPTPTLSAISLPLCLLYYVSGVGRTQLCVFLHLQQCR